MRDKVHVMTFFFFLIGIGAASFFVRRGEKEGNESRRSGMYRLFPIFNKKSSISSLKR